MLALSFPDISGKWGKLAHTQTQVLTDQNSEIIFCEALRLFNGLLLDFILNFFLSVYI